MIDRRRIARLAGVILIVSVSIASGHKLNGTFKYPEAPRSPTTDDYHGTKVADPYRPLEDPDAPATRAWVEAENKVTFRLLEIDPPARFDPPAVDRALGLREIRPALERRKPVLLHVQHGPAEPESPLHV